MVFIHNPRTGGRSLEAFFNVQKLSHAYPTEKLYEKLWLECFVVTSVRHPLDRFFSSYFGVVKSEKPNALVRKHGWGIKDLSPIEYLATIQRSPRNCGRQVQWTDFPSKEKPRADLVLRFEEIKQWESLMTAAGIDIGERQLPHKGKSQNKSGQQKDLLALTSTQMSELRDAVEDYYSDDYEAFEYRRDSGNSKNL